MLITSSLVGLASICLAFLSRNQSFRVPSRMSNEGSDHVSREGNVKLLTGGIFCHDAQSTVVLGDAQCADDVFRVQCLHEPDSVTDMHIDDSFQGLNLRNSD